MTTKPKTSRDYAREDNNRATIQVKARLLPEDNERVKSLKAQGYTLTDIMLAGLDAIEAKMHGAKLFLVPCRLLIDIRAPVAKILITRTARRQ